MSARVERDAPLDAREFARALFDVALRGADPRPATERAIGALARSAMPRASVIALGKAAPAMADGALRALRAAKVPLVGGIVVAAEPAPPVASELEVLVGDHPQPGPRSLVAAQRLEAAARAVPPDATAIVLLSGGTSSLVGAPVAGVEPGDLARLTTILLGAGCDIGVVNRIRKRFARWGAGRLALALVHAAAVQCLAISDVPGDDPALIGSGPCVGDPTRAAEIMRLLEVHGLLDELPPAMRAQLDAVRDGTSPETPKPGDKAIARVRMQVIATNASALAAAAELARRSGATVRIGAPLAGEARECGERLARELIAALREPLDGTRVMLWGGETAVTLGSDPGVGGRAQELALAASRLLRGARHSGETALLVAGTDGRDGPTDAAGAIVDGDTWDAIAARGADPLRALERHDAHGALDAVGALLRTGPTGTNVADIAIGILAAAHA